MLYYLSGGKTTNILHHNKLTRCQEDSRSSPKEFPASSYSASARCLEIQRESNHLQRTNHHPQYSADDLLLEAEDLILGSPASSLEESFKNDYREKLKVAQKKVLRETSFKRKDLQMSLPVRLRQKPSKRPSIEHLRSFSLSGASEDAKPVPCSPSHLESWESCTRDEEMKRPQMGRIGGRKRGTSYCGFISESMYVGHNEKNKKFNGDSRNVDWCSFCDPEKDGCDDRESKDNEVIGGVCCRDTKELTPEASIPVPRSGGEEDARVEEEERGTKSPNSNALIKCSDQQPVPPPGQVPRCHTVSAQPPHGDKDTAKGLVTQDTSVDDSQDDIVPERGTDLPQRRLRSPEDQRYEELALEIVAKDSSLVDVLLPHPVRKTALDLMEGLFPVNVSVLDKSHRKKGDVQHAQEDDSRKSSKDATEECPESEHDAKQRSEDPTSKGNRVPGRSRDGSNDLDDVTSKKQSLNERHKLLSRQREDAKDLKENLDRRERVVSGILAKYLTEQQLQDYRRFVQDKTSFYITIRKRLLVGLLRQFSPKGPVGDQPPSSNDQPLVMARFRAAHAA
ncbi:protein shroom1 isoform x1 [Limosa lapponica baueri]|uniref:Protein shroom1 isoform x1 n=1 Tax=Limosa lapponica baueri TaxID=1758121 RepID=A0A2I0TCC2_LIMLA|nr:protein shroom1 isoform x1 [Limosa lapponica baueri]